MKPLNFMSQLKQCFSIALSSKTPQKRKLKSFAVSISKMALVQSRTLPHLNVPLSPILSSLHAPSSLFLRREIRTVASPLSSSTAGNLPFSPSTRPRKLLCPPPRGKFVREDYLVKKLSAQELQELVKGDRKVPLIVDFYATWCGPCILMAQELEMLTVEYESNAIIVKVDTDDEYEFARDMQVRGLPTLFFISPDPSKDAIRTEGLIPIQMMRDIIDNEM